jgi:3-phosphoshikimate 1-carboxyvinyltransferase
MKSWLDIGREEIKIMSQEGIASDRLCILPGHPLRGELGPDEMYNLPGDKSLSHRAALFAALSNGHSRIENFLVSGVTRAMLDALTALGIAWELQGKTLQVEGVGLSNLHDLHGPVRIDCGNSATTLRLLAGALAAWNVSAILDGSPGLRRRPMRRILDPLQRMGVRIQGVNGCAPLNILPTQLPLAAIEHVLPVASAQVKSCLLLASLAANGPTTLSEPGPSRDHTERMLRAMGVEVVSSEAYTTRIIPPGGRPLVPLQATLPGDISAAAFLIVAALVTPGSQITLRGVGLNPTRTGLLEALAAMGGNVQVANRSEQGGEPLGDVIVAHSRLEGVRVDGDLVVRMIDEFPAFAVAAAFAQGTTTVSEASELRYKESDRISAMCSELSALGVQVSEKPDGFIIRGDGPPRGGAVNPHGDHRLAMSLAVAGLAAEDGVTVRGAQIIRESFPEFIPVLAYLGANIQSED